MVLYFTSVTEGGTYSLYMGRDKFENEELIKYGWPEDIWFHVDDLSSAHVYLRLPAGITLKTIPKSTLEDCAQLVKSNSIEGNKKTTGRVKIVYTPWSNLQKTGAMAVGQVGFFDPKLLCYTEVDKRDNSIINRLNKTKVEKDSKVIKESRDARDAEQRAREKTEKRMKSEEEKKLVEERKKEKEAKSYDNVFKPVTLKPLENMTSNAEVRVNDNFEDDFM